MKEKTCKICRGKFIPERQMQNVCSLECAIEYSKKHLNRVAKDKQKKRNKALRAFNATDKNILKKLAQKVFNAYIRKRDAGKGCISCGYSGNSRQIHAGHYKPRGSFSALAYNEDNVHAQCSICNVHLSGNLVEYRKNLIEKIGLERVEALETNRAIKRYEVEDYNAIIKTYRAKLKMF